MADNRQPKFFEIVGAGTVFEAAIAVYENNLNYALRVKDTFDIIVRFKDRRFNLTDNTAHELINNVEFSQACYRASTYWQQLSKMLESLFVHPDINVPLKQQILDRKPLPFRAGFDQSREDWESYISWNRKNTHALTERVQCAKISA